MGLEACIAHDIDLVGGVGRVWLISGHHHSIPRLKTDDIVGLDLNVDVSCKWIQQMLLIPQPTYRSILCRRICPETRGESRGQDPSPLLAPGRLC